jgi:hypothetical protein
MGQGNQRGGWSEKDAAMVGASAVWALHQRSLIKQSEIDTLVAWVIPEQWVYEGDQTWEAATPFKSGVVMFGNQQDDDGGVWQAASASQFTGVVDKHPRHTVQQNHAIAALERTTITSPRIFRVQRTALSVIPPPICQPLFRRASSRLRKWQLVGRRTRDGPSS